MPRCLQVVTSGRAAAAARPPDAPAPWPPPLLTRMSQRFSSNDYYVPRRRALPYFRSSCVYYIVSIMTECALGSIKYISSRSIVTAEPKISDHHLQPPLMGPVSSV